MGSIRLSSLFWQPWLAYSGAALVPIARSWRCGDNRRWSPTGTGGDFTSASESVTSVALPPVARLCRHIVPQLPISRAARGAAQSLERHAGRLEHLLVPLPHARGRGIGSVLVGFEIPRADHAAFNAFLERLHYHHEQETRPPADRLFL